MILKSYDFSSFDGVKLKIHELGEGKPLLLLHGLFSNAYINWIKYGHADRLAKAGYKVIMPDLRAHGASESSQNPDAYPKDVIVKDIEYLLDKMALGDFGLIGFSLGARTSAKLLVNGIRPNHIILCGMGWEGIKGWNERQGFFMDVIAHYDSAKRGDAYYMAVQFMKTTDIDPIAARHLLQSFGELDVDILCRLDRPILVVCGKQDQDNGSGYMLAANLKNAQFKEISGNHMSSVTDPSLSEEIINFLREK